MVAVKMKVGVTVGLIGLLFIPCCVSKCSSSVSHDEEGKLKVQAWKDEIKRLRSKGSSHSTEERSSSLRAVNEGSYSLLENGAGKFKVDIQGCPTASANIESVSVDDVEMGIIDMGVGEDGYKVYCPGPPRFGNIVLRVRRPNCDVNLMEDWFFDATKRENETKAVSISSFRLEGSTQVEVRRWDLDVVPLQYDPGDTLTPRDDLPTEVVTCAIHSLRMSSSDTADGSRKPGSELNKAFVSVERLDDAGQEDQVWASIRGGGENLREGEETECVTEKEDYVDENGEKATRLVAKARTKPVRTHSVAQLELAGPVTDGREELCGWFSAAVDGAEPGVEDLDAKIEELERSIAVRREKRRVMSEARRKATLRLRRLADGDEVGYEGAVATGYSFPKFSRSGSMDLSETVSFRPNGLVV